MHGADAGVAAKELGDCPGTGRLPLDPQRERLQPAQHQPAIERPRDAAAGGPPVPDAGEQPSVPADHGSAQHVRVTGNRLGQRVHRCHRAQVQRLLQQPCGHRVVDDHRAPGRGPRSTPGPSGQPPAAAGSSASRPTAPTAAPSGPAPRRRGRAGRRSSPPPRAAVVAPRAPACCSSRRPGTRCARLPSASVSISAIIAACPEAKVTAPASSIAPSASSTAAQPGLAMRP